jgi:hypothetical protein
VATNGGTPDVEPIGRWLLERSIPGGSRPASDFGYAKVAPFTGVRWENDQPIVRVRDQWSPLVSIDGIPIDRIMAFAHEEFGSLAHKRFTEDLPELPWKMGHEPAWTVTLGLQRPHGQIELLPTRMTTHNRGLARQ